MQATYENQPSKPPDLEGAGRAWRIQAPSVPEWQRKLDCGGWLIHAPHAHPVWPWYVASVISLREVDGQPIPPYIEFPGASHELLILALSPDAPIPDVDDWGGPGTPPMVFLSPVDQSIQFIVANDVQARQLLDKAVEMILDGASPDQDFRQWWALTVAAGAEHLRLDGHPRTR